MAKFIFETRVTDFIIQNNKSSKQFNCKNGTEMTANAVILATGHSARDIYELLHKKEIALKAKSFAMGVRVEHPQQIIDLYNTIVKENVMNYCQLRHIA